MKVVVRSFVVAVSLAGVIAGAPRDADACTCAPKVFAVSPADAAMDVPINAVVIASYDSYADVALREVAGGAAVQLAIERFGSGGTGGLWLIGRPATALKPDTQYELTVVSHETTKTRFRTGTATDTEAAPTTLTAFAPEVMEYPTADTGCINTCIEASNNNLITRMRFEMAAAPADAVLVTIDVLAADRTTVIDKLALREATDQTVGFQLCSLRAPALEAETLYCARLTSFDIAGNAATSEPICNTTATCASVTDPTLTCTPTRECLPVAGGSGGGSGSGNDDDDDDDDDGGCSATEGASLALCVLAVILLLRKRRRGCCDN